MNDTVTVVVVMMSVTVSVVVMSVTLHMEVHFILHERKLAKIIKMITSVVIKI